MTTDEFSGGRRRVRRTVKSASARKRTVKRAKRHIGEFEGGKRRVRRTRHVGGRSHKRHEGFDGGKARKLQSQTTKLIKAQSSLLKSLKALGTARRGTVSSAARRVKKRTTVKRRVVRRTRRVR